MRVTESRLIVIATDGVAKARERAADAGDAMSSGMRVSRPSQDGAAWAEGQRAAAVTQISQGRGSAMSRMKERLDETDRALGSIGDILGRATELAVGLANGTYDAAARADAAVEVRTLRGAAIAAANTRALDGEYILAGDRGAAAPFDAAGAYVGDAGERTIEIGEGQSAALGVPGTTLTAASGVDVFGVLDTLATALEANDQVGVRAQLGDLQTSVAQVARARVALGTRTNALTRADDARTEFEQSLAERRSSAVEVDAVAAASDLSRASAALESARASATELIRLARGLG